jgi:hypothetical protein
MKLSVLSTTFRLPLPNGFDKVDPASALADRVQKNGSLDAYPNSVAVYNYMNAPVIQFTLPNTQSDDLNMQAISDIVMRDVNEVARHYGIKV